MCSATVALLQMSLSTDVLVREREAAVHEFQLVPWNMKRSQAALEADMGCQT